MRAVLQMAGNQCGHLFILELRIPAQIVENRLLPTSDRMYGRRQTEAWSEHWDICIVMCLSNVSIVENLQQHHFDIVRCLESLNRHFREKKNIQVLKLHDM